jgi:hypothetical protein
MSNHSICDNNYNIVEPYVGCPYPCPCPWVLGGHVFDIIVHGWAWLIQYLLVVEVERSPHIPHHVVHGAFGFVHPCIQLQIGVKLLGCKEYVGQEALWAEASDNE